MKSYKTIDAYIASYPKEVQVLLKQMRETIRKAAPKTTEAIKYGLPTFVQHGNVVHFGGFKKHIGFFPAPSGIEAFNKETAKYQKGKGTLQFSINEKLPLSLVTKITKYRLKEDAKRVKSKSAK